MHKTTIFVIQNKAETMSVQLIERYYKEVDDLVQNGSLVCFILLQ